VIVFKNFSVWYKIGLTSKKIVLKEAEFSIQKNTITGIIGLNGEGKTSMIKAILGLNQNKNYELYIDSSIEENKSINNLLRISYVPEIPSNELNFTVKEYLQLNAMINSSRNDTDLENLTDKFKLNEYLSQRFSVISKGTKKRVLIVAALQADWELIVLDEPFEGLDIIQRDILKEFLIKESRGRYILISSHEVLELKQFCSSIIKVDQRKVYEFFHV